MPLGLFFETIVCLIFENTIDSIDVEDVKFVINYDYPNSSEDYVHRIGRTGRSHQTGTAYTFFTRNSAKQAADLILVLSEANQQIHPKLREMADEFQSRSTFRVHSISFYFGF